MLFAQKQYLKFVGVAALNAAVFITVRMKMHKASSKLNELNTEDFYEIHHFSQISNLYINPNELDNIKVSIASDTNGTYEWFGYKYKNVYFLFKKYNNQDYWSLFVDLQMCEVAKENFNEIYEEFLLKQECNEFKVLWENKKIINKN